MTAFLALGQESRLNVFRLLVQRGDTGLCPMEIIEQLGIPSATLSFHLKELLRAQLLRVERQGRRLIYRPDTERVTALSAFLLENCCGGQACGAGTDGLRCDTDLPQTPETNENRS